jgi:hypothetical protein
MSRGRITYAKERYCVRAPNAPFEDILRDETPQTLPNITD